MNKNHSPLLIAIVGGSGSGKTRLANKLCSALGEHAARISLDDFYRDRSKLSPARRAKINFDHPRAIDWTGLERVVRDLRAGRDTALPCYDFKTHCRRPESKPFRARPVVLMDGLWLLRRPALRRLLAMGIYIDCPRGTRLRRRISRDVVSRGRTRAAVCRQFRDAVEPMHARFVAPQKRWADVILRGDYGEREIKRLAEQLREQLKLIG